MKCLSVVFLPTLNPARMVWQIKGLKLWTSPWDLMSRQPLSDTYPTWSDLLRCVCCHGKYVCLSSFFPTSSNNKTTTTTTTWTAKGAVGGKCGVCWLKDPRGVSTRKAIFHLLYYALPNCKWGVVMCGLVLVCVWTQLMLFWQALINVVLLLFICDVFTFSPILWSCWWTLRSVCRISRSSHLFMMATIIARSLTEYDVQIKYQVFVLGHFYGTSRCAYVGNYGSLLEGGYQWNSKLAISWATCSFMCRSIYWDLHEVSLDVLLFTCTWRLYVFHS